MVWKRAARSAGRPAKAGGDFVLVLRGPDGNPRYEVFDTMAAYRARLDTLTQADSKGVSIDDIARLLDPRD